MPDVFFSDDSRQAHPSREGMGPLVAAGFIHVASESVRDLERDLDELCNQYGFPDGPAGEFKWSPGRELWMRDNLVDARRAAFFEEALGLAGTAGVQAVIVVEDTQRRPATTTTEHTTDVTVLMLERVQSLLGQLDRTGMVVVDRPSGDRADEDRFLQRCLETLSVGTDYVKFDRIATGVVSTPSSLVRLLQLADVVTSCTTALVAGEDRYAPTTFTSIRPLLREEWGRVGGVGLKIHPTLRYVNLYFHLVGDGHYQRGFQGYPLPQATFPYADDPTRE